MDIGQLLERDMELSRNAARLPRDPDAPFPVLLTKIKLTWACNLRCRVCALWRIPDKKDLPLERVIGLLRDLKQKGLRKVHLSGGEVFLVRDLPRILSAARELDLQVNLTTNGTLLDKGLARTLVEQRVHTVAFSIDAASEKQHDDMRGAPGAWKQTWKGLERLQARKAAKGRGPLIAVNTVVTRKNIDRPWGSA